jgi:hypothetical protein
LAGLTACLSGMVLDLGCRVGYNVSVAPGSSMTKGLCLRMHCVHADERSSRG